MNDANFLACRFSADIVPYMYDELSGSESSAFELHLLDCTECTDEFATVSGARYEVYEWKRLAFDPLATPRFEIPFDGDYAVPVSASLIDRVRTMFSSGWTAPAFAVGAVVIVSIFAASSILRSDAGSDLAVNRSNVPVVDKPASPVVATSERSDPRTRQNNPPEENSRREAQGARVSTVNRTEQRRTVRISRAPQPHSLEVRAASAQNKQIAPPRLNDFSDDEDKSLRLAELFDGVETSK